MHWYRAVSEVAAICLAFALVHSLCVTAAVKALMARLLGEGFVRGLYRLIYNAFSFLSTALVVYLIIHIPDERIWYAPDWLRWPMHAVQLLGLYLGLKAFEIFDNLEFLGLRQAWHYLSGRPVRGDEEGVRINRLVTTGIYGIVRNPMYLGGLLIFTFSPRLTRSWLTVGLLADAYFVYGAWIEERRMLRKFGPQYVQYMKEVPRLIPRPGAVLRALRGRRKK